MQMQQPRFGLGGAVGQQGGMSGPQRGPLPGMQQGGGAFATVPQHQQNAFGAQQNAFGGPGSFAGPQRSAAQQPSGFGDADPFASGTGGFGGGSDSFGASSNAFTQVKSDKLLL